MSESTGEKDGHNGHFEHAEETDAEAVSESTTPSPTPILMSGTTTNGDKKKSPRNTPNMVKSPVEVAPASHHQQSHQKTQARPDSSEGHKNSNSRPKSAKVKSQQQQVVQNQGSSSSRSSSNEQNKNPEIPNSEQPPTKNKVSNLKTSFDAKVVQDDRGEPPKNSSNNDGTSQKSQKKVSPTFDSSKGSKKNPQATKPPGEKPIRLTVPVSPFESGSNTECIQLLRQLWNVHEEAIQFLGQIRVALSQLRQQLRDQENNFESSLREKRHSNATSSTGNLAGSGGSSSAISGGLGGGNGSQQDFLDGVDGWIPLQTFIDGLQSISDNFSDIEKQFATLSNFQAQCKLTLFAKVKHAKLQVSHDRLSIMHGIQQLITVSLNLLASPSFWCVTEKGKVIKLVQNVFQLTEIYNWVLESSWSRASTTTTTTTKASSEETNSKTSSMTSMESPTAAAAATNSTVPNNNRKVSANSIQVLIQINAANRNDSALLRLSLKPLSGTRLLQILAQKRSTFAAHSFSKTILANFYANPTGVLSPDKFEICYSDEDLGLGPLMKGFSQCPSLLGRAAVKKTENGDQRLCKSTRTKMYSYFHQVLWTLAGEQAEDLLLFGPFSNVSLVLQPLDSFIALRNALTLGHHFQDSNLSPMSAAFESVSGALNSFSLLANWDEKMRTALDETFRVKRPEHISLIAKPEPSQWATEIGAKFGLIITSCLSMIDSGSHHHATNSNRPLNAIRQIPNEEEALGNEAQVFFRLEASLVYFKAWVVKRSKVWLNGWAIPQFLAISQRESALLVKLIKSRESLLITRDFLLNHEDISIRLSAKHRKACAEDLRAALLQVQSMPDELLQAVGPVCRTLSLATLQSYMPPASHWKGLGLGSGPDKPSNYVGVFIGRVIEPVITASVELIPGPIQEAMGKQVVHAACDAWLQYILHKKIRFSEWGAVQLLRDFTAFREWIRTETELEKEARRAILKLEVLKTCEGVAYLLLRNPGDILGVGVGKKPSRKNRRVAPSSSRDSIEESSPDGGTASDSTADDIPAEMYVPNQQMWLALRLRRNYFTPPCC